MNINKQFMFMFLLILVECQLGALGDSNIRGQNIKVTDKIFKKIHDNLYIIGYGPNIFQQYSASVPNNIIDDNNTHKNYIANKYVSASISDRRSTPGTTTERSRESLSLLSLSKTELTVPNAQTSLLSVNENKTSKEHRRFVRSSSSNAEKLKRGLNNFITNRNPASYFVPVFNAPIDTTTNPQQQQQQQNSSELIDNINDQSEFMKLNINTNSNINNNFNTNSNIDIDESSQQQQQQQQDRETQQLQTMSETNLIFQQQTTEPPQQLTGTQLLAEPLSLVNSQATGEGVINVAPRLPKKGPPGFVLRWGRRR